MSVNALANNTKNIARYVLMAVLTVMSTCLYAQSNDVTKEEAEADSLLELQDYVGAEKRYTHILTKSKNTSTNPQLFYKRAYAYFGLEQFQPALKDINIYLKQNSTDSQAKLLRANIYQSLGEIDHA